MYDAHNGRALSALADILFKAQNPHVVGVCAASIRKTLLETGLPDTTADLMALADAAAATPASATNDPQGAYGVVLIAEAPAPTRMLPFGVGPLLAVPNDPGPAGDYATCAQMQTVGKLLDSPVVTRAERTAVLTNIGLLGALQADELLDAIRTTLEQRAAAQAVAA